MAIYHLSGSVISRSQGRSAVACAAYRSASELRDNKYEKTHDYTHKQDVAFSEIFLPENAPAWMKDREKLWNAVEACEKRKDAQLAREIQISLPRELTQEQNIELAREYIQKEFVDRGMVADWAFHLDKLPDGELQPHVHVMLTMREITPEGFGQKNREWNRKENLLMWREDWAEVANRHLSLNGHDICIDHRSYKEQGIELEPQYKIGTSAAYGRMARFADHERIARENGDRIYANPSIALDALTRQQSTFTHQDLARLVNRQTVDGEQFQRVYEKVKGSEQIVYLGLDAKGCERFTSQAMVELEQRMLEQSNILIGRQEHGIRESAQQLGMIDRNLSEEQQYVYKHLLEKGDLKCVVGYAGTGKSYLLGAARAAWEAEGYRVLGATLAGIAAENLEASSGIESRTLASRLYYWDKGEQLLTSKDILIVDEAGMLGSRQMESLLNEATKHHAKVVLLGDPQQLQAIEAGAAFRGISDRVGFIELTEIRRQQQEWQREATKEFATGKTANAIERYQSHSHVHEFETQAMAKKALVELWNDVRISDGDKTQLMLSYTRKDAQELNVMARDMRKSLGELGEDKLLITAKGEKLFAENDRVYFLKNDRALEVKNGSLGTIEKIDGDRLTIRLDRENLNSLQDMQKIQRAQQVVIDLKQYNHLDYGYAATIHKGQGVTVDRSYVLASKYLDSHATYVGMSRHRESADLFWSREEFAQLRDLTSCLSRERVKDISLDYEQTKQSYAHERGIGIEVSRELTQTLGKTVVKEAEALAKQAAPDFIKEFGLENFADKRLGITNIAKLGEEASQREFAELMAFKKEFEKANPELSKTLQKETRLAHEKRAVAIYREYKALEEKREKSYFPKEVMCDMQKLAAKTLKDKDVMNYLRQQAPQFSERLQSLAKEHEKSLKRDFGLGLSL